MKATVRWLMTFGLVCAVCAPAGADYQKGLEAYRSGDYQSALRQWLALGERGNAAAYTLGTMYATGWGGRQDRAEAVTWFRVAADGGDALAQYRLGGIFASGLGVARDDGEAVKWLRLAAAQNLAEAQNDLGLMYKFGRGVAANDGEAVRWFRRAAEQGMAAAQYNLGLMYDHGRGVTEDPAAAAAWFGLAADQGDGYAQNALAALYLEGRGVARNPNAAYLWFDLAAAHGMVMAEPNRDRAAARMTGEQVAEGRRLAREWRPARRPAAAPLAEAGPPPAPADGPDVVLVMRVQRGLAALGYAPGPVDGIVGPRTRAAIRAFERANRLPVTGQISAAIIARIEQASPLKLAAR